MTAAASRAHSWDPAAYAANSGSQESWARELLARLNLQGTERVLDVGCGDGRITADLARSLRHGAVLGIDASSRMIEFAREKFPAERFHNLAFRVMDARRIHLEEPVDLIYSSSVLHWVDDHPAFLRGAAGCLREGGRLVVSCGGKGNAQDVFLAFRPEMRMKHWRDHFRRMERPYFFHAPEDYRRWLPKFGFKPLRIRLAPKDAVYDGRGKFAAWLRTTWLPYTERVPEADREDFIDGVVDRFVKRNPPDANGRIHVRMVRLEIEAEKAPG